MRNEETTGATQSKNSWGSLIGTFIVALVTTLTLSTILQLLHAPLFLSILIIIVVANVGMRISANTLTHNEEHPSFWTAMKQSW